MEHRTGDVTHLSHEVHAARPAPARTAVDGPAPHSVSSTPISNPRRRCSWVLVGTLKGVLRTRGRNTECGIATREIIRRSQILSDCTSCQDESIGRSEAQWWE